MPGGRGFWSPVRIPFPGHLAPARPSTAAGNNAVVSAGRASTRRPFDCHEVARKPQIARAAPHACPAPRATRAVSVAGFRARRGAESALPPPRASRLALRRAPQSARGPLGTARPPERRPSDGERPSEGVLASPPEPPREPTCVCGSGGTPQAAGCCAFRCACNPCTDALAEPHTPPDCASRGCPTPASRAQVHHCEQGGREWSTQPKGSSVCVCGWVPTSAPL